MANRDLVKGVIIGVAAAALAPVVLRALGVRSDMLGQAAIRAGTLLGEKAREFATEVGEIAEDVVAEMQAGRTMDAEPPADDEVPDRPAVRSV